MYQLSKHSQAAKEYAHPVANLDKANALPLPVVTVGRSPGATVAKVVSVIAPIRNGME